MLRVSKIITIGLALAAVACTVKTDPELENRIARLEQRCDQLNQELSSLSDLVNATGSGDWVTDVTPVTEDGVVTGYLVNFYVHGPILITCGKDGADGKSPALGVTTLEDGNLYWTLNGAVLKDAAGKPVSAQGVTPQMKVEDGNWYVSYDGGKTWTYAGSATAVPEGQVVFKDVTVDTQAGNVTFTLSDGSTFAASLKPSVEIMLDTEGLEAPIVGGETITIGYTLTGADENTLVTAASDGNYKVTVKKEGTKGGKILVTAPQDYTDGFVNVILSNGRGYTYVKVINFYERKGFVSGGGRDYEYTVPTVGGTFEIPISVNFPYTVKTDVSWIEFIGTRAPLHTDKLQFNVQKNESNSARTGKVYIYPDNNPTKAFLTITFNQASAYFSIEKTQFIIDAEGGSFPTGIHTSKDFTVSIPAEASWLTSSITSLEAGEYTLTLKADANPGTARRQADVKLVGANNATLATLFVAQYASEEDERAAMIITVSVNYANDFSVGLPLYAYSSSDLKNVLIDWGDGTVEHWTKPEKSPSHTYEGLEIGRTFDVKITGTVNYLSTRALSTMQKDAILAVKQWGKLNVTNLQCYSRNGAAIGGHFICGAFEGCRNLTSIPDDTDYSFQNLKSADWAFADCTGLQSIPGQLFVSCPSATSFDSVFRGCTGIFAIPDNLFAKCVSATDFWGCFYGCTGLQSLPGGLFADCVSAADFGSCFYDCTALQSLPEKLFSDCVSASSFASCFYNCTGIQSLPENLFASCTAATSFKSCFYNCTGIQSLPENLFASCVSASYYESCFYNCTGIQSLPENLFASCTAATSFKSCFYNCTGIQSLPENLFAGCVAATSFQSCFYNCTGIRSLPENLFDRCFSVTDFSYCFDLCTSLQVVPEKLFADCSSVTNLSYCFGGCRSIENIPVNLLDHNRKIYEFEGAFGSCNLTGESPYTIISGKKIHLYERADYPDYFHAPTSYRHCFYGCTKLTDYASIPSAWK